jgi:hypothetical protein
MKQKLEKICKNIKAKAHDKKIKWEFMHACKKVKRAHNKVNAHRFKILRTCLKNMDRLGIPVTAEEKDLMARMIALYDETLLELGDDTKRFREYVEMDKQHL